MQALFNGHSELTVHSGLQLGGLPKYPGEHVHTACSLLTRHWLFGPQGFGKHGCFGVSTKKFNFYVE